MSTEQPLSENIMSDDRRMTTDRFFGGVDRRLDNLQSMLAYLSSDPRSEDELWTWITSNTAASSDSTISTYVRFIRTLGLIEREDRVYTVTERGTEYLHEKDNTLLFSSLTSKVKGFETILQASFNRHSDYSRRGTYIYRRFWHYGPSRQHILGNLLSS
ncbi:hypothetical protein HSB1_38920 [Halogranum salarium B-1]|uniref:Uncharacterized protein n=1 Tax=Halogranum salarium B-1 TaxID=1210908 RepID=J3EU43_9EURY|nr:hypothetical protein HSB1_38920 [Halogranum salarium B-1]